MIDHERMLSAADHEGFAAAETDTQVPPFAIGDRVRVTRYGAGVVARTEWDLVTVNFGGRERSFHPDFVRPARARPERVAGSP